MFVLTRQRSGNHRNNFGKEICGKEIQIRVESGSPAHFVLAASTYYSTLHFNVTSTRGPVLHRLLFVSRSRANLIETSSFVVAKSFKFLTLCLCLLFLLFLSFFLFSEFFTTPRSNRAEQRSLSLYNFAIRRRNAGPRKTTHVLTYISDESCISWNFSLFPSLSLSLSLPFLLFPHSRSHPVISLTLSAAKSTTCSFSRLISRRLRGLKLSKVESWKFVLRIGATINPRYYDDCDSLSAFSRSGEH